MTGEPSTRRRGVHRRRPARRVLVRQPFPALVGMPGVRLVRLVHDLDDPVVAYGDVTSLIVPAALLFPMGQP